MGTTLFLKLVKSVRRVVRSSSMVATLDEEALPISGRAASRAVKAVPMFPVSVVRSVTTMVLCAALKSALEAESLAAVLTRGSSAVRSDAMVYARKFSVYALL